VAGLAEEFVLGFSVVRIFFDVTACRVQFDLWID